MLSRLPVALCIMAKLPNAGACKTRLVPALSYEQAAELSRAFVRDTVENVLAVAQQTNAVGWVAYTPDAGAAELRKAFGGDIATLAQRGTAFGERLLNAIVDLLAAGHRAVCVIDSDSPTLPPATLRRAVEACDGSDRVVIGPATDGGYYLLGLARAQSELFEGISWSTALVAAQTVARARDIGLPIMFLREWYDVDDASDLETLSNELSSKQPKGGYFAPYTRAAMARLGTAPAVESFAALQ
jgi:rSAM/selenodomain-associated transferase 1